jgi:succinate dehydrogenase/fumarate reductase flavoprotein subunit
MTTYDIIIIGAGSAGMPCAIQAATRGKKVLVLEKQNHAGGTLHFTAGHLSAGGTNFQQEKGITDSVEEHWQDVLHISKNTVDEPVSKKAVTLAPGTINWLQQLGFPFHERTPLIIYGHEAYGKPRTYFGRDDYAAKDIIGSGKMVYKTLLPIWEKYVNEGKITFATNHKLVALHTHAGKVNEIVIEHNSEQKTISTNGVPVVVTTGGYAANNNLYQQLMKPFADNKNLHFPKRLISTANLASQGEGLLAIQNIGGQIVGADKHMSTLGGVELEPNSGRADFWTAWARVSNSHDRTPREIYVNDNGERFMNEHDLTVDERERVVMQQPNQRFYVVFTEEALQAGPCIVVQWTPEKFKAEAAKEKCAWAANSLTELAKKINVPATNLENQANKFTKYVAQQRDEDFGRTVLQYDFAKGPYYALLVYAYSLISFGGIKVNAKLQVLNQQQEPIENLYAAGEILGAGATSGNAFCGGMLLTPAISFGKYLGETL